MCMRYLGFLLLVWFPAQSAAQSCAAPTLERGYFVPEPKTINHNDTKLSYACDEGFKPAVEGWWATITCQNGKWSHQPQCIDERACLPPTIPHAKVTGSPSGWYENGHIIRITCDKGYTHRDHQATATCTNGLWSSVPVCDRSNDACYAPPKIPHTVIIQEYQEVFAADSEVTYECEDGYTVEGGDLQNSVICISGSWSQLPRCRSSINSTDSPFTAVSRCGKPPVVPDGQVAQTHDMFLKFQCDSFYRLQGPQKVKCYNDGTWSELPICKATYCTVNTAEQPDLVHDGVKYLKDGDKVELDCEDKYWMKHFAVVKCTDGRATISRCCNRIQISTAFGDLISSGRLLPDQTGVSAYEVDGQVFLTEVLHSLRRHYYRTNASTTDTSLSSNSATDPLTDHTATFLPHIDCEQLVALQP